MTDKKKSIIEETLATFESIENHLNSNTKEILRSVSKEEITSTLNESLREDDFDDEYEISDIEGDDGDVDALPVDAEPAMGAEPEMGMEPEMGGGDELPMGDSPEPELGLGGGEELGMDAVDGGLGLGAEEGSEDYEMDMTGASDEDVISVYKKLSGEDEIEVVSPNEVIITDPVSGAEYNVKMGGGESLIDQGEMGLDGELEAEPSMEPEMDMEPEIGVEPELDAEPAMDAEPEAEEPSFDAEPEAGESEEESESPEEEEEEEEVGESVVYEVELSEDAEEVAEDIIRGKGHDKELVTTTAPNSGDIEGQKASGTSTGAKAVKPGSGGEAAQGVTQSGLASGDIEGQTAEKDKEIKGDNLTGGFKDDGQNGTGDNHAQHIMEEDETLDEEDVVEGEEVVDESIPKANSDSRRVPGQAKLGQPVGTGAKHVPGVAGGKQVESVVKKYNALLAEAKKIKAENDMFRNSLKGFRKMLGETAVFNSNLTYVTKLFLEHSTTTAEKQQILERFDNEVVTIEESKKLYKNIVSEMKTKKPLAETVENKIVSEQATSQSTQINERKLYVDPAQARIMDLINRTRR